MSRQPIRQRPPADDDMRPALEVESQKQREVAAATKQPANSQAVLSARVDAVAYAGHLHPADRHAYFVGRYAPLDTDVVPLMAEFGVPMSLSQCVLDLARILREKGLPAALAALHRDAAIKPEYAGPASRILARLADKEGRP